MTAADSYQATAQTFRFTTAANSSSDVTVSSHPMLTLVCYSTGLSLAGTAQLVFNADTGANYVNSWISYDSTPTPTRTSNASAAAVIFTPSQTTPFMAVFHITNIVSVAKAFTYRIYYQTADVTTVGLVQFGGGEWINTTAAISSIRMIASANNYGVDSGFFVYGGAGL